MKRLPDFGGLFCWSLPGLFFTTFSFYLFFNIKCDRRQKQERELEIQP